MEKLSLGIDYSFNSNTDLPKIYLYKTLNQKGVCGQGVVYVKNEITFLRLLNRWNKFDTSGTKFWGEY